MNFKDYSEVSLKRESLRNKEIAEVMAKESSQRLLHAFIGIQTEASELLEAYIDAEIWENHATGNLDIINCLEEIGDMAFYVNIAIDVLGLDWRDLQAAVSPSIEKGDLILVQETVCLGSELMDIIKRQLFYGTELNTEKASVHLKAIFNNLTILTEILGSNWEEVLDKNNRKLELRTGKKFNAETVVNRDTEKEREELEK